MENNPALPNKPEEKNQVKPPKANPHGLLAVGILATSLAGSGKDEGVELKPRIDLLNGQNKEDGLSGSLNPQAVGTDKSKSA